MPFGLAIESQRVMAYSMLDYGVDPEIVVDSLIDAEESLLSEVLGFIMGLVDFDMAYGDIEFDESYWEDEILGIASEILGINEETIWLALDEGQTLASLASAQDIDPQILIDRLISEEEAWITELLADGALSEEEAEEWRSDSRELVVEIVNEPWF